MTGTMTSELRRAVEALASTVRKMVQVGEKAFPDAEERTYVNEFLLSMETMLIDQLATSVRDRNEQERILSKYELDFLLEELAIENDRRDLIEYELDLGGEQ